jgi:hypothetical protein
MNERLKGIAAFWLAAALPLVGLYYISKMFGSYWFVSFALIYVLIYRPVITIFRLLRLNAIEEKDAWRFFIPFVHNKYFRTIWFG